MTLLKFLSFRMSSADDPRERFIELDEVASDDITILPAQYIISIDELKEELESLYKRRRTIDKTRDNVYKISAEILSLKNNLACLQVKYTFV